MINSLQNLGKEVQHLDKDEVQILLNEAKEQSRSYDREEALTSFVNILKQTFFSRNITPQDRLIIADEVREEFEFMANHDLQAP